MLHQLIDQEDPRCLYCHSECDIQLIGNAVNIASNDNYEVAILHCRYSLCQEIFEIHSLQKADGETDYLGFTFTCKDFCVHHRYIKETFQIGDSGLLFGGVNSLIGIDIKYNTFVPQFVVDFSDKDKLEAKIKTYRLFS